MSERKVCGYEWDTRFKKIRRVVRNVPQTPGSSEYDRKRDILSLASMTKFSVCLSVGLDQVAKVANLCYNLLGGLWRKRK